MVSTKILIAFFFVCCAYILEVDSLKCYTCTGTNECKSPKKVDCSQSNANETRTYFNVHYKNVNMDETRNSYICVKDSISDTSGNYMKSGCLYSGEDPCTLQLKPEHPSSYSRCCQRCERDYCNPAGRAAVSVAAMLGGFIAIASLRRLIGY